MIRENPALWFVPMPDFTERPFGVTYNFDDDIVILTSIWIA